MCSTYIKLKQKILWKKKKIKNVTQLQVVDKIQNDDVILLIRDTGNGKQCFQIKGIDFRGESAYEAALKQGFVGTYQDWTQHIKEITKYKSKPKTQYIIGKAIPIGKLNGGARLNAYVVTSDIFRFKLSDVPQLAKILNNGDNSVPDFEKVDNALADVTWHLFIDDREVKLFNVSTTCNGNILQLEPVEDAASTGFYQLDESKSSVDLSSDMYIYLRYVSELREVVKFTSQTLYYRAGKRIWEPNFGLPQIGKNGFQINGCGGRNFLQLQKLLTRQRRSRISGLGKQSISKFGYRGQRVLNCPHRGGIYRYRIVFKGKKTQWRTISILKIGYHWLIK